MDNQSLSVRYWSFDGPLPEDVIAGRISIGIAYHVERAERLAYVRVLARDTGAPAWEMWLDRDTAQELATSLHTLEPWFRSSAIADEVTAGGTHTEDQGEG